MKKVVITFLIALLSIVIHILTGRALFILTGTVSKLTCSLVFVSKRPLSFGIYPEVNSISSFAKFTDNIIDHDNKIVTSRVILPLIGVCSSRSAKFINEQIGCQLTEAKIGQDITPSVKIVHKPQYVQHKGLLKETTHKNDKLEQLFDNQFNNASLETRALLVVHNNEIIAERYANGFHKDMPQHGWSIAKSVLNALIGICQYKGKMHVYDDLIAKEWTKSRNITWDDLLRMSSGLEWDEDYDNILSDVVRMFFKSYDYANIAAKKSLLYLPSTYWLYSSGTTALLSRQVRSLFASDEEYWKFPHEELFNKIGMETTAYEIDPSGNFASPGFGYYTARALANFGLLYVNDGVWNGERILPEGWVKYTSTPSKSTHRYGAQFWLVRSRDDNDTEGLPSDLFYAWGYNEQYCIIIPSKKVVIVRFARMADAQRLKQFWNWPKFVKEVLDTL